eukprot:460092-Hanusia_phi.AAC.1
MQNHDSRARVRRSPGFLTTPVHLAVGITNRSDPAREVLAPSPSDPAREVLAPSPGQVRQRSHV